MIKIYRKVIAEIAEPSLFISIFDKERNEEAELGMKERVSNITNIISIR